MAIMTQCLHIMGGITLLVTVVLANAIPAEVVARDFGTTAVDAMDVLAREPNEKRCEEKLCCRTGNIGTWGSFCEVRFGKAQPDSYQVDCQSPLTLDYGYWSGACQTRGFDAGFGITAYCCAGVDGSNNCQQGCV